MSHPYKEKSQELEFKNTNKIKNKKRKVREEKQTKTCRV
jgi:hypothetical protein